MKKPKIVGSIYSGEYNGLTVRGGRLINNRPTDRTGIAQERMEKVNMIADGVRLGEFLSDAMESEM